MRIRRRASPIRVLSFARRLACSYRSITHALDAARWLQSRNPFFASMNGVGMGHS